LQTSRMEALQEIFRDVLDDPALCIDRSSSALTVPGWDSLAHVRLVVAVEQQFKIKFALGELEQLKNVGEMLDLMERKIQSKR
jgi:acyl carrier protein